MPSDRFTVTSRVFGPIRSEADLLLRLLQGFGVVSSDEGAAPERSAVPVAALRETLDRFLTGLGPLGANAVLVIDDEDGLPEDVTTRLRALETFEVDGRRIVEIVNFASGASAIETASWFRVPLAAGIAVALLACAVAVGLTAIVYNRFGF